MEKCADKEVQVGVNNPRAARLVLGSGHCRQGLRALHRLFRGKGQLSVQEQRKKQNNCQKLLGTKQKKRNLSLHLGKLQLSAHPHCEMNVRLENTCSCSIPPSWRQDPMDFWSGPIWQLRVIFEEAALRFLQESCESLWVAGRWECNTALE